MSFHQKVVRAAYGAVSKLLELQLRGVGDEADDDEAAPTDRAALLQPMGVAVLPIVARTLRADVEQDGGEPYVKRLWDKARTPTDLESGETRLYAVGAIATALRLLTGAAVLEAPSIKLGAAATKKVNREGDPVDCGTLTFAFTPGMAAALSITYTPPAGGGAPTVLAAGSGDISLIGRTGAGSSKVLAED
ncbi:MAG: hypothetical protein Q8S73_36945 [Deltaproteobacteria bacterium]|nr:hypothetical protein [Myxococcales bacterium]MDP3219748.1 hypothetical protein [Deltaproteobacteria bacterium]